MTLLTVHELSKHFDDRTLFEGVSLAVDEGERIGIVGVNGCGKSTFLKILAGLEPSDGGTLALRRGARVGYLAQEPVLDPGRSLREEAAEALSEHRAALEAHARVSAALAAGDGDERALLAEMDRLTSEIEHRGGWSLDNRIEAVLMPLGLTDLDRPVLGLSGGERKRLALGKVLLAEPDLLLLDEPTNHLDADTVLWLEGYLPTYPGAILLITHDRLFLDNVVGRIVEVAEGTLFTYPGAYEAYLIGKAERMERAQTRQDRRLGLLRTELEWLRRGPKARGTKAQARIDRAHELMVGGEVTEDLSADMFFAQPDRLGKTILEAKGVTVRVGERTLVSDFSTRLKRGERVGIIGPNGSGKTTLLKVLLGELKPSAGEVVHGLHTSFAYFDQLRAELDERRTVTEVLCEGNDWVDVGGQRMHVVTYLERFLFSAGTHRMPVAMLSGGERNRLILARLMSQGSNVIVLDEPTNDLDLLTLQALEAALVGFGGCVLVVTHDRSFLDKVATSIWSFEGEGQVVQYVGNYTTYRTLRNQRENAERARSAAGEAAQRAQAADRARAERTSQRKAKLSFAEARELAALPDQIEALEASKADVEARLADPDLYRRGPAEATALSTRLQALEQDLSRAYSRWEALEARAAEA